MRDYLKSLGSFSWAMSLFGLKNLGALMSFSGLRRRGGQPAGANAGLDAVTKTLTEQLGAVLKAVFHSGDAFVRGLVDLTLGRPRRRPATMPWLNPPPPGPDDGAPGSPPEPPPGSPSSTEPPSAAAPAVSGWGPMPPIPDTPATAAAPQT